MALAFEGGAWLQPLRMIRIRDLFMVSVRYKLRMDILSGTLSRFWMYRNSSSISRRILRFIDFTSAFRAILQIGLHQANVDVCWPPLFIPVRCNPFRN